MFSVLVFMFLIESEIQLGCAIKRIYIRARIAFFQKSYNYERSFGESDGINVVLLKLYSASCAGWGRVSHSFYSFHTVKTFLNLKYNTNITNLFW